MYEKLVEAGNPKKLRRLLDKGGDPMRDAEGRTALYCHALQPEMTRVLLGAGADPNVESTGEGEGTPLRFATCWGEVEAARVLLEGGADPNLREDGGTGNSPLHWAAQGGHTETVDLLLQHGADPNALTGSGSLPLHAAARRGSLPVARSLLDGGADPRARDAEGETALDVAEERWSDPDAELRRHAELRRTFEQKIEWKRVDTPDGEAFEVTTTHRLGSTDCHLVYPGIVALLREAPSRP